MNKPMLVFASLSILLSAWSSYASAFPSQESLSLCEQNPEDFPANMSGFNQVSGVWTIRENCIIGEGDRDVQIISERSARNFVYEANITAVQGVAAALVFRSNATGSEAYYATLDVAADGIKLWRSGANASTLAFARDLDLELGTAYELKVDVVEETITVFLDGREVLSVEDREYVRDGLFGLNVYRGESVFRSVRYSNRVAGDWSASSNQLEATSSNNGFLASSEDYSDVTFSADVSVAEEGRAAALMLRSRFEGNRLVAGYVITLDVAANQLKLWGPGVDVAYTDVPLNHDQVYRLKVEAEGHLIRAYLNDNLVLQVRDETYSTGTVGVNVFGGSAIFKNIMVGDQNALWPLGPDVIEGSFDPEYPAEVAANIPISGTVNRNFRHVHQVVVDQLARSNATAAVLEIRSHRGVLLLGGGYGWLDRAKTKETPTNAMMRIASISKSYTSQAIWQLINEGTLAMNARAFCLNEEAPSGTGCLLPVSPFGVPDTRVGGITLLHLLKHANGWDEGVADGNGVRDPLHNSDLIANILGVSNPPSYQDLLNYRLGQPLDYEPPVRFEGADRGFAPIGNSVYGSYGYTVLSQILEMYSGQSFIDYIRDNVTEPAGVPDADIALGQELVALRDPREPEYISSNTRRVQNKFGPPGDEVFGPDGGGHVANAMGAGGLITTAPGLMQYVRRYQLHRPELRDLSTITRWGFGGSGDGVLAAAASDKDLPGLNTHYDWAWMLNSRHNSNGFYERLEFAVRNILRKDVPINGIEAITSERRLTGFRLPSDASVLSFSFESSGNQNCDDAQNWYRTRRYANADTVRHKGILYSATMANRDVEPPRGNATSDQWENVGRCEAKPEILARRDAVPTDDNYDCKTSSVGNTTCEIRNAPAGFYYVTVKAKDYDFSGASITTTYSR